MVTGNTLLKKNALIASLLVIGKTSFRSSIIQDAGSCAQRLSKKFIPVHAAAVVPGPLERPAAHPHSALTVSYSCVSVLAVFELRKEPFLFLR